MDNVRNSDCYNSGCCVNKKRKSSVSKTLCQNLAYPPRQIVQLFEKIMLGQRKVNVGCAEVRDSIESRSGSTSKCKDNQMSIEPSQFFAPV